MRETELIGNTDLSQEALEYWGLDDDGVITPDPLSFEENSDHQLLVKTSIVNQITGIRSQLNKDTVRSRVVLLFGMRGSGKTTVMRYLNTLVSDKDDLCFIECQISPDTTNLTEFKKSVHKSILRAMAIYLHQKKKVTQEFHDEVQGVIQKNNNDAIRLKLENVFKVVCSSFGKRIIFIDDLDKIEFENQAIVRNYFIQEQGFYNIFTRRNNNLVFIALQDLPAIDYTHDINLNYLVGKIINIRQWSNLELDELLTRRLQSVYLRGHFRLEDFFTSPARIMIYNSNEYNPRWSLAAVRKLLNRAYLVSADNTEPKPLDENFCSLYSDDVKAIRKSDPPDLQNYNILEGHVRGLYKGANSKIVQVITKYPSRRFELIKTLVAVYNNMEIESYAAADTLDSEGLIQRTSKKYVLATDLVKLFDHIDRNLHHDAKSMFYFLMLIWNKV